MQESQIKFQNILLVIGLVFFSTPAFAQPSNNACSNATVLTPAGSCNSTSGTTVSATQSIAPITCNGFSAGSALDVWYQFTATATSHTVTVVGSASFDPVIDVRSGACTGSNIACADATASGGTETVSLSSLTIGNTYLVRVYGFSGTGTFSICVTMPAPANDACSNATTLTPASTCSATSGTTVGATQSVAPVTCNGSTASSALDVWYKFTATASKTTVYVAGDSGFDPVFDLRSSPCNGSSLNCADLTSTGAAEAITFTSLTVGTTYYVRVYGYSGTGTFSICVITPTPDNNTCSNATTLTPATSCNATSGTTIGSSQSISPLTCNGATSSSALDVWYNFTATATTHTVTVVGSGSFDPIIDVLSGACNGTNIACADATAGGGSETVTMTTLTVGTTYLVRVYGYNNVMGDFTICVTATLLPVELTYFEGRVEGHSNILAWETASEENTQYHIIERSAKGYDDWEEIGRLDASGTTTSLNHYQLIDSHPLSMGYYRLKSVDFDKKFSYSNVVSIERNSDSFMVTNIYPVPAATDKVTMVVMLSEHTELSVSITDITGRVVALSTFEGTKGSNDFHMDVSHLPASTYFVRLSNGNSIITKRIIKT